MPVYTANAADCPAVQTPAAAVTAPTVAAALAGGETDELLTRFNDNAEQLDITGQLGGGGYAVGIGLELTDGGGQLLAVSAGVALADGARQIAATTQALGNNVWTWVYVNNAGTLVLATHTAATPVPAIPAGAKVFLGRVKTLAGAITEIDYSGRLQHYRDGLKRKTNDAGPPTDTPPAGIMFWAETATGLYRWTGTAYASLAGGDGLVPDLITAAEYQFVPSGRQLRVKRLLRIEGRLRVEGKVFIED